MKIRKSELKKLIREEVGGPRGSSNDVIEDLSVRLLDAGWVDGDSRYVLFNGERCHVDSFDKDGYTIDLYRHSSDDRAPFQAWLHHGGAGIEQAPRMNLSMTLGDKNQVKRADYEASEGAVSAISAAIDRWSELR